MNLAKHPRAFIVLIVLSLMIWDGLCDCPIQRYLSQIMIGQVKILQYHLSDNRITQLRYVHQLKDPLPKRNPNIIIGLTGYSYTRAGNSAEFEIKNVANGQLTSLTFSIISQGVFRSQRIYNLRFMAVKKEFTQIQVGTYKGHPTTSPIPSNFTLQSPSLSMNTQVAIFLNGFKGNNLDSQWDLQLTNPRLQSGQLKYDFVSSLSASLIDSVTYSYLLYNKVELSLKNEVSLQTLQFDTTANLRLKFNSLRFTDLTFFGISKITSMPGSVQFIDLVLDDRLSSDMGLIVQSNQFKVRFQVSLWQSFIKQSFICSFCKDGSILYDGRYCVSQCPGNTISQQGQFLQECRKCSIEQIRVLDPVSRRCVCALQYFQKSGQCTACHYTCLTCVGESNQDCLTCDVSSTSKLTFRELIKPNTNSLTGRCNCPGNGFYEETMNLRCLTCYPDCLTCTGHTDTECVECNRQRVKNEFGMCVCRQGFTSQPDGSCLCVNPKYEANGACINPLGSCGVNEVEVTENMRVSLIENRNSKNSNENGNRKNKGSSNNKTSKQQSGSIKNYKATCQCRSGLFRVKGQCLPCGPNEQYNQQKGICQCLRQAFKHSKTGACIRCLPHKKYDRETQTCICRNKNQFLDSQGNCIICPQRGIFHEGQCYCANNYFMNQKRKCQKCRRKTDNPLCKKYESTDE